MIKLGNIIEKETPTFLHVTTLTHIPAENLENARALQGGLNRAGDMNQGVTHQINGTLNHSAMTTCLADIFERLRTKFTISGKRVILVL